MDILPKMDLFPRKKKMSKIPKYLRREFALEKSNTEKTEFIGSEICFFIRVIYKTILSFYDGPTNSANRYCFTWLINFYDKIFTIILIFVMLMARYKLVTIIFWCLQPLRRLRFRFRLTV